MKFSYFPVFGKGFSILCSLEEHASGKYEAKKVAMEEWAEMKPTTFFGQLPVLDTEDCGQVAQSAALMQYIANKFDAGGKDLKEKVHSEMLMGLADDIFADMAKGHPTIMAKDKGGEEVLKATWEAIALKLANAEKFIDGKDKFTEKGNTVGEFQLFSILHQCVLCKEDLLSKTPNVEKFYKRMVALPSVVNVLGGKTPFGEMIQYFALPSA